MDMTGFWGRLWRGWFYGVVATSFMLLFPLYVLMLWMKFPHRHIHFLRRHHARLTCLLFTGLRFRSRPGPRHPLRQGERPAIVCANHASYLDIFAILATLGGHYRFLGKMELADWPAFGYFFRRMDISVNRASPRQAALAYEKAQRLLEKGESLVFFPEGTIPDDAPQLSRFKDGAFKLAYQSGCPIWPVAVLGSQEALPWNQATGRPKRIEVVFEEPILPGEASPETPKPWHRLKEQTFAVIEKQLARYYENYRRSSGPRRGPGETAL
jgi:1-acyl-sn-glycerol-3-phosphate acyltransferase